MALITNIIPAQNFEVIRDAIGFVLAEELANQFALTSDEDLNAKVWIERILPFHHTDVPAVNVLFNGGNYTQQTTINSDGDYTYFIDVYHSAKTSATKDGDKTASIKLHKLLGVCRAILENPIYRTLGIAPPSLQHTSVTTISIADAKDNQDAVSVMMGRLTFNVRACETTKLADGLALFSSTTTVKLGNTDKGYIFIQE